MGSNKVYSAMQPEPQLNINIHLLQTVKPHTLRATVIRRRQALQDQHDCAHAQPNELRLPIFVLHNSFSFSAVDTNFCTLPA